VGQAGQVVALAGAGGGVFNIFLFRQFFLTIPFELDVLRSFDNTTVSGRVSLHGTSIDASLTFYARAGGAIEARATADRQGAYSVGLAPGTYDLYVTRTFGSAVFLGRVLIPHATAYELPIPLTDGFLLSGLTLDASGHATSASVRIDSPTRLDLTTDASGAFSIVLPQGPYTITATVSLRGKVLNVATGEFVAEPKAEVKRQQSSVSIWVGPWWGSLRLDNFDGQLIGRTTLEAIDKFVAEAKPQLK